MERPLRELEGLAGEYGVPVLCAGDVFDHWAATPELINWLLTTITRRPFLYAIPGQHDLPYHNLEDIHKSAFWTLVKAGFVEYVTSPYQLGSISVSGFPFGVEPKRAKPTMGLLKVALIHRYVWVGKHSYPGAPTEQEAKGVASLYRGYDVLVFGDNHKGFDTHCGDTTVWNCGTFMRRKADEIAYQPRIGVLFLDGAIAEHELDISGEVIEKAEVGADLPEGTTADIDRLVSELMTLKWSIPDFADAISKVLDKKRVSKPVRTIILEALEHAQHK